MFVFCEPKPQTNADMGYVLYPIQSDYARVGERREWKEEAKELEGSEVNSESLKQF